MSIIYSYPVKDQNAQPDDLLVISDSADKNRTKQIKISQLPSASGASVLLTTDGTTGPATLIGDVLNIPDYSLPLAADGTRGGLQIGFISSLPAGAITEFALKLSNEQGFVEVPAAGFSKLGLVKVGGCQGVFPGKLVELNSDELFRVETIEAGPNDPEYNFALTRLPVMTDQQKGIAKVYAPTYDGSVENITTAQNRTYGVQRDSNDKLVVNVPWVEGGAGSITSVVGTSPIQAQTQGGVATISSGVYENSTQGDVPSGGALGQYLDGDGTWKNLPATPAVNNGTLTITVNGSATTFTANQANNSSVSINTSAATETGFSPLSIYDGENTLGVQAGAITMFAHMTSDVTMAVNACKLMLPETPSTNNQADQKDAEFSVAIYSGSLSDYFNSNGAEVPQLLGEFEYIPGASPVFGIKKVLTKGESPPDIQLTAGADYVLAVSVSAGGPLLWGKGAQNTVGEVTYGTEIFKERYLNIGKNAGFLNSNGGFAAAGSFDTIIPVSVEGAFAWNWKYCIHFFKEAIAQAEGESEVSETERRLQETRDAIAELEGQVANNQTEGMSEEIIASLLNTLREREKALAIRAQQESSGVNLA